jgi:hypothetical protein
MKFFIPIIKDEKQFESVYKSIKDFAHDSMGWTIENDRIYEIQFKDKQEYVTVTVGKRCPITNQRIYAILKSHNSYLICTTNRGVIRGIPVLVGIDDIMSIKHFDE